MALERYRSHLQTKLVIFNAKILEVFFSQTTAVMTVLTVLEKNMNSSKYNILPFEGNASHLCRPPSDVFLFLKMPFRFMAQLEENSCQMD